MNGDQQALRERLHEEFGALEISPPPVLRVTGRGQGVRARRRAMAAGTAVLAALAVVAAAHFGNRPPAPTVTLNSPNPAAPGGVFASGTADGKPWALAVRNIAASGSGRCLPAVMFNGRDGDVLFKVARGTPSFGNPAFLTSIAGFPGIGVAFTQVARDTARLVLTFPHGRKISARPVLVHACGTSFNLAGLAFGTHPEPSEIATFTGTRLGGGLVLGPGVPGAGLYPPSSAGIWASLDKTRADAAASVAAHPIGAGTVDGEIWHIRTTLGLFGQCYAASLRDTTARHGNRGRGQGAACVPVSAPPRAVDLVSVPVQSPRIDLPGYAGLVSPRTAYVLASVSNGTIRRVVPVDVDGRAYIALVVPAGCTVTELGLFDAYGHVFATSNGVPAGGQPIPGLPQPHGTAGSS